MKSVDGGWSWIICGCSLLSHMLTSGFSLAIGVYYVEFLEIFNESKGTTAWVSALNFGTLCLAGPGASLLNHRYGTRVTMFTGGFISALGLFLYSFATEFYVVLLTFGLTTGLGSGFVYNSAIVVISEYFVKYLPLALGLSMAGGGFGNFLFPWITKILLAEFGWRGALQISSGLVLNVCVAAMLILKATPKTSVLKKKQQARKDFSTSQLKDHDIENFEGEGTEEENERYNLNKTSCTNSEYKRQIDEKLQEESVRQQTSEILHDSRMLALLLNSLMFLFGLSVVFTHVAAYAESQGISASLGRALVSVIGGGALTGKIGLGILSQIPCTNTIVLYIAAVALTGLSSILLAVWTLPSGMIISACMFGFFQTAMGPTVSECAFLIVGPRKFNVALGLVLIIMGFGWILGAPAAGIIYDVTLHYPNSFFLGGTVIIVAAVVMVPVAVSATRYVQSNR